MPDLTDHTPREEIGVWIEMIGRDEVTYWIPNGRMETQGERLVVRNDEEVVLIVDVNQVRLARHSTRHGLRLPWEPAPHA